MRELHKKPVRKEKDIMLNDTLKTLLGDDLFNQVSTKLGSLSEEDKAKVNIVNIGDGSYIPRTKYNDVNTTVADLKQQIADRDTQLETLKKDNKGNEDLLKQIKDLQDANKTITLDYEKKLETQSRDYAISEALTGAKVRNVKTILPLLDNDKIIYKDGKIAGLNEQVEAIKKDNAFLFEETKPHTGGFNPNPGAVNKGDGANNNDVMNGLIRGTL